MQANGLFYNGWKLDFIFVQNVDSAKFDLSLSMFTLLSNHYAFKIWRSESTSQNICLNDYISLILKLVTRANSSIVPIILHFTDMLFTEIDHVI